MALVKISVQQQAGTIILDRPEKRNALTRELLVELDQALQDLLHERQVRAVVLTGAGSAFCAGMDLDEMRATAESPDPQAQWGEDAMQYRDLLVTMLEFPKPIIAAVNGPAVAGGAGLVLACDLVVGSPEAKFGLPEPRRGIVAGIVGPLLAFRVGAGQAARLLLNPTPIEAAEAHRIGLYHELALLQQIWVRAVALAGECAHGAPSALQLTKRMLNETIGERLMTQLAAGAALSAAARTTEAAREGLDAFLERRDPQW